MQHYKRYKIFSFYLNIVLTFLTNICKTVLTSIYGFDAIYDATPCDVIYNDTLCDVIYNNTFCAVGKLHSQVFVVHILWIGRYKHTSALMYPLHWPIINAYCLSFRYHRIWRQKILLSVVHRRSCFCVSYRVDSWLRLFLCKAIKTEVNVNIIFKTLCTLRPDLRIVLRGKSDLLFNIQYRNC